MKAFDESKCLILKHQTPSLGNDLNGKEYYFSYAKKVACEFVYYASKIIKERKLLQHNLSAKRKQKKISN